MKSWLKGYILVKEEDYKLLLSNLVILHQVNENLRKTIEEQNQNIQVLTKRVEELESQLHQNGQNSHKPPSTDAFKKPIKNSRELSDRKQGGQNGHEGRTLKIVENADKIIEHNGSCELKGNVQYGSKLKGFMVYLNQYEYIPYNRLQELMMDYFDIPVGDGTIESGSEFMYDNLESGESFFKQELIDSEVNHNDESGIRCEKKLKAAKVVIMDAHNLLSA